VNLSSVPCGRRDGRASSRETPDSPVPRYRYCSRMDAAGDMACYLAEWYLPDLTEHSVDDIVARLDAAAITVAREGTEVRLRLVLAVPTDEVLFGVFAAESPDIVSRTCARAGAPYQRLSGEVSARMRHLVEPEPMFP
jgi:hypothetical protein